MSYFSPEEEVTCPYCKEDFEVNTDDGAHYKDGESEEETCPHCEKIMLIYSSCSWNRRANAADCLNDGKHPYSEWSTLWIVEQGENKGKFLERRSCETCDHEERGMHEKRFGTNESKRFDEAPIGSYS